MYKRQAQELVDLADKTVQEFRREPELRGVISIGSGDLEGMHLLAGWLASFQALHPQVTYQLYSFVRQIHQLLCPAAQQHAVVGQNNPMAAALEQLNPCLLYTSRCV